MNPNMRGERGSAAVWLVIAAPVLFLFAGLVLDGGRVLTARQKTANIAEQAARAGVDTLDIATYRTSGIDQVNPARAHAAACGYVAAVSPGASCEVTTSGNQVSVTVRITTPTAVLAAIGYSSFTLTGTATARAAVGLDTES